MKHAYVLWIVLNVQLFILPQNIKIHNGIKILHLPRSLKIMIFTQMKVLHCYLHIQRKINLVTCKCISNIYI
jgi:hypothetical protein